MHSSAARAVQVDAANKATPETTASKDDPDVGRRCDIRTPVRALRTRNAHQGADHGRYLGCNTLRIWRPRTESRRTKVRAATRLQRQSRRGAFKAAKAAIPASAPARCTSMSHLAVPPAGVTPMAPPAS